MQVAEPETQTTTRETFNRPPRIWPSFPPGKVLIPAPPKRDELPTKQSSITMMLPLILMGLMVGVYVLAKQQLIFLLPMMAFSLMSPLGTLLTARQKSKQVKRQWKRGDKKYRELLQTLHAQFKDKADEQRRLALLKDPNNTDLEAFIRERTHLWERRPEDPDFLAVRVGLGTQPFTIEMQAPEIDSADSMLTEVQQFQKDFTLVKEMPCSVSLTRVKSLGITGPRQIVADFARGFLCQIAALHSPEDVRIMGLFPTSQQQDWEWLKELPHTLPLKQSKKSKLERLFASGQEEADLLLNVLLEELSLRATKGNDERNGEKPAPTSMTGVQEMPLPHLVVMVHDYIEARKHPALSNAFKLGEQLGVSVIYLVAQAQAIPGECRGIVRIVDQDSLNYAATGYAGETLQDVRPDIMEVALARRIARELAPLQIAIGGVDTVDLASNVRLLDLLGIAHADQVDIEQWWSQPPFGRLRIPMGMGLNGPVWIDFNDNAHGPHGIIAGTTGAGKSELLSSLIVGLALTHHPHLVNFVLVDFKGGAAFKPFEKIPHTVGFVSDLSGKLTERALHALKSELKRREHILGEANAKKIAQYQAMRAQNPSAYQPLPNLFIIIDEFAELAKEHPNFMEGLVSVVQKGRSLGVHLILATQKPTGSVNPNIWSNLKFRICLRVASVQDSRDMLGRSEAGLLPFGIPGRAYFQVGTEIFELFQSARISLPARISTAGTPPVDVLSKQASMDAEEVTDQKVLMDMIEPYTATIGAELFRPWPDPLPARISLLEINQRHDMPPRAEPSIADVNVSQPPYGWLNCPVGLVDLPVEQRQEPLMLDMARQGGHVLVAGASGSGKSVFLRTLITSLAQTHTPAQLHMYLVDFGGQALRAFEKLPHVGGIFGESDNEYIRRLLRKLFSIIEERKNICREQQVDDFLAYQRRRQEKPSMPELPAVVLVIDKFIEFKQAFDKEMDLVIAIARFGRSYGVSLVLSVDRPIAVSSQLLSLIDLRLGLRLVELTDSLILLGKSDAAHLDPAVPGRAYRRGQTLDDVQIALPTAGDDDDEQNRLLMELVAQIAQDAEGNPAPPIQLLPEYVNIDDFLVEAAFRSSGDPQATHTIRLRIGIEDLSLQPIVLELNADTPHALVVGGPGSGRTGVLQTSLMMLASTPDYVDAKVILVDFRRTSRPMRRLPNVWLYADTEERLIDAVSQLKDKLSARVVGLRKELEQQVDDDEPIGQDLTPILLIIDDYDQLTALTKNPIIDLKEFLLQSRDLNLHILVAGAPADLGRSDPLLAQARAGRLGIVLGADPNEQSVLGVRMTDMLPGRGFLVRRNKRDLVQFAHLTQETQLNWVKNLAQAAKARQKPPAPVHSCPWCLVEKPHNNASDTPTTEEMQALVNASDIPTAEEVQALANSSNTLIAEEALELVNSSDNPTVEEVQALAGV